MMRKVRCLARLIEINLIVSLIIGLVLINGCTKKVEKQPSKKEVGEGWSKKIMPEMPEKGDEKMVVEKGDKIKVQYTGRLADGSTFDKSKEGAPLEFTVGGEQVIPGLDKAVEGMKLNEEKEVTIKAEEAYGNRDEDLIREFPRASLPEDFKPEKGMVIRLQDQSGRKIPGKIIDIDENNITIDLNHPLAGDDLTFDIKVVGIE